MEETVHPLAFLEEGILKTAAERLGLSTPEPPAPGSFPDVSVSPTYKIAVEFLINGQWLTVLNFDQAVPLSAQSIAKLVAKAQVHAPKPAAIKIIQNGNTIHEETL